MGSLFQTTLCGAVECFALKSRPTWNNMDEKANFPLQFGTQLVLIGCAKILDVTLHSSKHPADSCLWQRWHQVTLLRFQFFIKDQANENISNWQTHFRENGLSHHIMYICGSGLNEHVRVCNLDLIQFIFCRTAVHVCEVQLNSSSSKLRLSLKTASFSAGVRFLDRGKAVTCLPGPTRDFNDGSYIIALKRPRFCSPLFYGEKSYSNNHQPVGRAVIAPAWDPAANCSANHEDTWVSSAWFQLLIKRLKNCRSEVASCSWNS